jgi:DNA (cytosine-5)-methyltransferase 1
MRVLSLFAGAGGLDRGFDNAGFEIVWANEYDKAIWETFGANFPKEKTILDTRSIVDIPSNEIPNDIDGIIGGPPCQSWSEFGSNRGIADPRGQLFFQYARVIEDKRPKFFLAENVSGILAARHRPALDGIIARLEQAGPGYHVWHKLLNTKGFGVPQDRERVIFVGYRRDQNKAFEFPEPTRTVRTLYNTIWDLWYPKDQVVPALLGNKANPNLVIPNHEYFESTYSPHYMSRNRVRGWFEPSFTIQAGARHAPIHPQANKMIWVAKDKFEFDVTSDKPYRRLSVRECARIQTFPDSFRFIYTNVSDGYKMIGNAVPVKFAEILARKIKADFR